MFREIGRERRGARAVEIVKDERADAEIQQGESDGAAGAAKLLRQPARSKL